MPTMTHPRLAAALVAALALPALAACTDNTSSSSSSKGGDRTISVTSTDSSCKLSKDEAPSGNLVYKVKNNGSKVTEFYLYGEDGLRIVGEVENVGPGLSRNLVINVPAGKYVPACKPGMTGKGIRSDFDGHPVQRQGRGVGRDQAAGGGRQRAVPVLRLATRPSSCWPAPRRSSRRTRPATTTRHARCSRWCASTTNASSPWPSRSATSTRAWTCARPTSSRVRSGPAGTASRRTCGRRRRATSSCRSLAARRSPTSCCADTVTLNDRAAKLHFTVDQIGNGAKGLLDEVAKSKITGEEETWSHTDLYDFQANVDGARVAFEGLKPVLQQKDPQLEKEIQQRFDDLQKLLDQYKRGSGYVIYTELTQGAGQGALGRGERALRAALEADRSGDVVGG